MFANLRMGDASSRAPRLGHGGGTMDSIFRRVVRFLAIWATKLLDLTYRLGQRGQHLELTREYPPDDEPEQVDRIIKILSDKVENDYPGERVLRPAHPKSNGLVRAEFIVEPDLAEDLRVGLFKHPRTYKAWIRFSNAVDHVTPDYEEDLRGLAMKVFDVDGEKLLDDEKHTHDFLFVAHDSFFIGNAREFGDFFESLVKRGGPVWFFVSRPRNLLNVLVGLRRYASPLEIRWFSVAPFLFGSRAVKYSLRPSQRGTRIPENVTEDYLHEVMSKQLAAADASFDFMIQFQSDAKQMPIENTLIPWKEKLAPFVKVATVRIPAQTFDSPEQRQFNEGLSFNPWHCLPEHRPLGGVNRARRDVMKALSDFRLKMNGATRLEPTGDEQF